MTQRVPPLTEAQLKEIAEAINKRASDPTDPCPNCGKTGSIVADATGRVGFAYYDDKATGSIACVATVCPHCGLIRQFSARVLNLSFPVFPSATSLENVLG